MVADNSGVEVPAGKLLSAQEREVFTRISMGEAPHSHRAQALLAIDEGATQAAAGEAAGLTSGQVNYWLAKFRKEGLAMFPEDALLEPEPAAVCEAPEKTTKKGKKGKKKAKVKKGKKDTKDKKDKKGKKEISMAKKKKKKKGKENQSHVQIADELTNEGEIPWESLPKIKRKQFDKKLRPLHVEMVKLQEWVKASGAKVCVLFEGRDTAGKGGIIKRITERVSPRVFRVVALGVPTEREKSQMYFQRYIPHLPAAGEVVLFDRSWYNRAGVERVMGFATPEQVDTFLGYAPNVERAIIASGVILIKYWLEVNMEEQAKRFRERDEDLRKIWKLSPMDLEAQARWYDYSRARDAMFAATDTPESPWYVVPSDDQRRARLNCIAHFLSLIPYEEIPREPIEFPERQEMGDYQEPHYPYHYIPNRY